MSHVYLQNKDQIDHLILECGASGYSRAQIAACIGISRDRLGRWTKDNRDLAELLDRADTLAQSWWEGQAQSGGAQSRIGPSVWSKSMAARFPKDYAERLEQGTIGETDRTNKIEWEVVDPQEEKPDNAE